MNEMAYNKVISLEDFSNEEFNRIIQDVFRYELKQYPTEYPNGVPNPLQWKIAMGIKALKQFDVLHRDALILGVGAGTDIMSFYLTKFAKQVFAVDLYFDEIWREDAPFLMMVEPQNFAPFKYDNNRLVVQHMDSRCLQYPENSFDGIYSCGSIEHSTSVEYIANASYEMGRVLKPGGILSISTEYKISGPPEEDGWDDKVFILSREKILHNIVEASGLEPVDEIDLLITDSTFQTSRDLTTILESNKRDDSWKVKSQNSPVLIFVHKGFVYCSLHLTLRKTDQYPLKDNHWAAPSEKTRRIIEKQQQLMIEKNISPKNTVSIHAGSNWAANSDHVNQSMSENDIFSIIYHHNDWQSLRLSGDVFAQRIPLIKRSMILGFIVKTIYRIRKWGKVWEAQSEVNKAIISAFNKLLEDKQHLIQEQQDQVASIEELKTSNANLKNSIEEIKASSANLKYSIGEINASNANLKFSIEEIKVSRNNPDILIKELIKSNTDLLARIINHENFIAHHKKNDKIIRVDSSNNTIDAKNCTLFANGIEFSIYVDKKAEDIISKPILAQAFEIKDIYPHYAALFDLVPAGSKVLDLGAHIGTFSFFAGSQGYEVLAVEASTVNAALLRESIKENNYNNIQVENFVVSDHKGEINFYQDGPYGHISEDLGNPKNITVPSVTIDDLLSQKGWRKVDFIKMDIEGAEISAIQGMKDLLSRSDAPTILFESNGIALNHFGWTTNDLMTSLEAFGYRCFYFRPGKLHPIDSKDIQILVIEDCLAVKNIDLDPLKWRITPPFTFNEKIDYITICCEHPNVDIRTHIGRSLRFAKPDILANERVQRGLGQLKKAEEPIVRNEVSWWNSAIFSEESI
jgi:FkbM family methyltransferase